MKRTFGSLLLAVAIPASLIACKSDSEQQDRDVTVSWSDTKQTMSGFGASSAFFGASITDAVADQLFDAKKGIGLSLLRTMIGLPDDTQSDGSQPADNPTTVATAPELQTAQQAVARGAKVWATAWTPPPAWKTTNNKNGSGDGYPDNKLKPAHYQDYADYLAKFVDLMAKNNVPLIALSPANEPDYVATWDNAQWSPDELAKFVAENLGPTFATCCKDVKIVTPDTASWPNVDSYVTQLFAKAKDYVPVIATHPYTNGNQPVDLHYSKPRDNGKEFWETEWSQENMAGDTPDPSMVSAIDMAKHIHDHLATAWMNAWNWWAIYISADALKSADEIKKRQNPALIQPDEKMGDSYMFKRGWAFGNWSKFVRPGFKRIAATDNPKNGVLIEAYRDDSSHIAIIAINTTSKPVTQKFTIDGYSVDRLTPWITSPNDDLTDKSSISASDGFTYDLPSQSVVTFVNWDAKNETPGQVDIPSNGKDAGADTRSSSGGLDCSNPVVPNNGGNGGVTDFTDWKGSTGKWGDTQGLFGAIYKYAGPKPTSKMDATVDTAAKNFHVKGQVEQGDYGGAGLAFSVCATVASFSKVQFVLAGSSPGCSLELHIKTFEQQPITDVPAGGCYQDAGDTCYNFPSVKQVATPTAEPQTVVVPFSDVSGWTEDMAGRVVGLQWQFTGTNIDPDAGTFCPIDVTITGVKFLP